MELRKSFSNTVRTVNLFITDLISTRTRMILIYGKKNLYGCLEEFLQESPIRFLKIGICKLISVIPKERLLVSNLQVSIKETPIMKNLVEPPICSFITHLTTKECL